MTKWLHILFFLSAPIFVAAQISLPKTNDAVVASKAQNWDHAVELIDIALADPKESLDAYSWYVAGFIWKEKYKTEESDLRSSQMREKAVNFLQKSLSMDKEKKYRKDIDAAIRYLAISYFNDALKRSKEIKAATENEPEEIYKKFRDLLRSISPLTDFSEYDKQMFKSLGQSHYHLWEVNTTDKRHAVKSNDYFQKVLILDENDCDALNNLVILHYNQGVYAIRSINLQSDMSDLIVKQDEAIRMFHLALPYAQQCFDNCKRSPEYYKALMYCHRALGNDEEYDRLKKDFEVTFGNHIGK